VTRRYLALAVALALAGTLVFPSAAAPLFGGPSDDIGEGVVVTPASGSGGAYASVDDGELSLRFGRDAGLNADAVTWFEDVFRLGYDGGTNATVWVTSSSPAVSFFVAGERIDAAATGVFLAGNESVAVDVRVDTAAASVGRVVDNLTVHSRVAERPTRTVAAAAPDSVVQSVVTTGQSRSFSMTAPPAGEPVRLDTSELTVDTEAGSEATLSSLSVTASSGRPLSVTVERAAGPPTGSLPTAAAAEPLGAVRVTTGGAADAVAAAEFRVTVERAYLSAVNASADELALYRYSDGEYGRLPVSVVERRPETVVVAAETPGFSTFVLAADRPALRVTDAALSASRVAANESATVAATVRNAGGAPGERTVAVTVNGSTVASRSVSLGPGETATVSASLSPAPGEYEVGVAGVDAGTLVVRNASAGDSDAGDAGNEPTDGGDTERVSAPATDTASSPQAELANLGLLVLPGLFVVAALSVTVVVLARRGVDQ
jgi:hypothetical protein